MNKKIGFIAAILLLSAGMVFGQASATLNGRIVDQGGAVVPGANVVVTNASTGAARDTVTNGEGLYNVPALNPGTYSVKVEHAGFAAAVRDGVQLLAGSTLSVDLQLGVAQQQQTVEVSGSAAAIETTQSELANSVRQTEVSELPMLNRSLSAMINLVPGAREVPISGAASHGQGAMYVSFGGGAGRNNNMLVDGVDNKDEQDGGSVMNYSLEAIQEFRAITSNFPAEYGKTSVVVVMATKSGTNNLHGSGFVQGRNQSMTATDYFSQPANGGIGKLPFSRMQYGGSFGGPLIKDKLWYFGAAERVQQNFNLPRPGNFYTQGQYLIGIVPDVLNTHSTPQDSRDLLITGKVNYQPRENQTFFLKYAEQDGYVNNDALTPQYTQLTTAPLSDQNKLKVFTETGGWTSVLSPTAVNQLSLLWEYYKHDSIYNYDSSGCLAIPGVAPVPAHCFAADTRFPDVSTGYINAFRHFQNFERKYQEKDDFSKQIGRHALKAGGDIEEFPLYGGNFSPGSPGNINFFADPSVIVTNSNGLYPKGFQTPGIVRSISVTSGVPSLYASLNAWAAGGYVQDDYKVSSRVTLNFGVRYDFNSMWDQPQWSDNRVLQALFAIRNKFATNTSTYYGATLPSMALPHSDKTEWQPRFGLAWDLGGNGKNVLRAGAGIFYDQGLITSIFSPNLLSKPIIDYTTTITDPAVGQGALANYVYNVTPPPVGVLAPTSLPVGQSIVGAFFSPNFKDAHTDQFHAGFSHALGQSSVLAIDYTHILSLNGWRALDINPLINGVRPLSALTQAVLGDPNLFGSVNMLASVDRSLYDEMAVHFERRRGRLSFQANYTLAWARGMGGTADRSTQSGAVQPQVGNADGGVLSSPWEFGPAVYDERHRLVVAGIYTLPWGIEVSPSLTLASARPYTQFRAPNPNGDGFLQILCSSGNQNDVGFGAGEVPCGVNNARGNATFVLNARVTKAFTLGKEDRKLTIYGEFYNMTNRANFGGNYNPYAYSPTTYNLPNAFIGGIGSVSTIPNSFQMQVGGRYTF